MKSNPILFAILSSLILVTSASADKKTLHLTANHWFPYVSFETEAPKGIAIEKLNSIAKGLGISVIISNVPFKRALLATENGQYDGMVVAAKTKDREKFMAFSDPIFCDRRNLYVAKGGGFDWQQEKALRGKLFGVGRGFYNGRTVQGWIEDGLVEKVEVNHAEQLFHLLIAKRVDLITFSEREADTLVRKLSLEGIIEALEPPVYMNELRIGFSLNADGAALAERASKVIRELKLGETCNKPI